jgi:hypothetical protein
MENNLSRRVFPRDSLSDFRYCIGPGQAKVIDLFLRTKCYPGQRANPITASVSALIKYHRVCAEPQCSSVSALTSNRLGTMAQGRVKNLCDYSITQTFAKRAGQAGSLPLQI